VVPDFASRRSQGRPTYPAARPSRCGLRAA
jgi:hypothetical protein